MTFLCFTDNGKYNTKCSVHERGHAMIHTTPRDNIPFVRLVVIDIVSEGLEMRHSKDGGKVWKKFSVKLVKFIF